mmetsp:Transcript_22582/g.56480  ORF Transcript_22582/g.56480 Transcript_22582/m.56480 type:complete len:338 (-) Transcript_22582:120-1133(-)
MTVANICLHLKKSDESAKDLNATGMLAEVFRTAMLHKDGAEPALTIFTFVSDDAKFVRKHLKSGGGRASDALAQAVKAIGAMTEAEKRKLGPERAEVAEQIGKLGAQADLSANKNKKPEHVRAGAVTGQLMCRGCHKEGAPGEKLSRCAQCQSAYYCSRECQKGDWKRHKMECSPPTSNKVDMTSTTNTALSFVNSNIRAIRQRMREMSSGKRRDKKAKIHDYVLNVDFFEGALEGKFKLWEFDKFCNCECLPAFCVDPSNPQIGDMITRLIASAKQTRANLGPNMILVVVRDLAGSVAICRSQNKMPDSTQLFSDAYLNMSEEEALMEEVRLLRPM